MKIRRYRIFAENRVHKETKELVTFFVLKEYMFSAPSIATGYTGDETDTYIKEYRTITGHPNFNLIKRYKKLLETKCPDGIFIEENKVKL